MQTKTHNAVIKVE